MGMSQNRRVVETTFRAVDGLSPVLLKLAGGAQSVDREVDKALASVKSFDRQIQAQSGAAARVEASNRRVAESFADLRLKADMAARSGSGMEKLAARADLAGAAAGRAAEKYTAMEAAGSRLAVAGGAIALGMGAVTKQALDWEQSFASVKKTVDGVDFDRLESELRQLAKTMPVAHDEIAQVAAAAGALGVSGPKIASFTRTALQLGEAVDDLDAKSAATEMARFANVMGTFSKPMSDGKENVDRLASALVHLGNNGASTEGEILSMAQRIAGAGRLVGASEADVLALANTMSSLGINAELGGSSMSRVMRMMYTAVKGGGDDLAAFAKVAGRSAEEFAQVWSRSPVEAVQLFVGGLNRIDAAGGNVVEALNTVKIRGEEDMNVFLRLKGGADNLAQSLKDGAEGWNAGTKAAEEASKKYETNLGRIRVAVNQAKDAAIDMGAAIAPAVSAIAQAGGAAASAFSALPGPVKGAVGALAALSAVTLLVGGGLLSVVGKAAAAKAALAELGIASVGASGKLAMVGRSVGAMGIAASALMVAGGAVKSALGDVASGSAVAQRSLEQYMKVGREAEGVTGLMRRGFGDLGAAVNEVLDSGAWNRVNNALGEVGSGFGLFGGSQSSDAVEFFRELDTAMAGLATGGSADAARDAFRRVGEEAQRQGYSIEQVKDLLPQYSAAASQAASVSGDAAGAHRAQAAAVDAAAAAAAGLTVEQYQSTKTMKAQEERARELTAQLEQYRSAVGSLGAALLGARAAQRSYIDTLDAADDALAKNGRTLDQATSAGRANQAALDGVAKSGTAAAEAILRNGGSFEAAAGSIRTTRADFIAAAQRFGVTGSQAAELADQLGLTEDAIIGLAKQFGQPLPPLRLLVDNSQALSAISQTMQAMSGIPGMGGLASLAAGLQSAVNLAPSLLRAQTAAATQTRRKYVPTATGSGGGSASSRAPVSSDYGAEIASSLGGRVESTPSGRVVLVPLRAELELDRIAAERTRGQLRDLLTGVKVEPSVDSVAARATAGVDRLRDVLEGFIRAYGDATRQVALDGARSGASAAPSGSSASGSYSYAGALGQAPASLRAAFIAAGAKYGVAPELLAAVAKQESNFNSRAVSPAGARGLMQFMPGTARQYGVDTSSAASSIDGAARMLRDLLARFDGKTNLALAGYNAGPGNVTNGRWQSFSETRQYVAKIMADPGLARTAAGAASKVTATAAAPTGDRQAQFIEVLKALKAAGLNIRENVALGDKVDPVHSKNSWHYKPGGSSAADITGTQAQMDAAAKILNDGGFRTIWKSMVGGNHFNHVHADISTGQSIGARGRGSLPGYAGPSSGVRASAVGRVVDAASQAVDHIAKVRDDLAKSLGELGVSLSAAQLAKLTPDRVLDLARGLELSKGHLSELAEAYDRAGRDAEGASTRLRELQDEHRAFVESMSAKTVAGGSLASLFKVDSEGMATSVSAIIDARRKAIDEAKAFGVEIEALKASGLNDADLRDVVNMGASSGLIFAKGLKEAGPAAVSELNLLQNSLTVEADRLARTSGDALYAAAEQSSNELLRGFLADEGRARRELTEYGQRLVGYIHAGIAGVAAPPVPQAKIPTGAPAQQRINVTVDAPKPVLPDRMILEIEGQPVTAIVKRAVSSSARVGATFGAR